MSGVLTEEGFSSASTFCVNLRHLEGTNCYCSSESVERIREAMRALSPNGLHWIDTGDYHYLSVFFLEKIDTPFELILLDNHSDRQPLAFEEEGMLSCGSWVAWAEEHCPNLKRTVSIGVDGNCAVDASVLEGGLPVYISLDLDVLAAGEFVTDWNQGRMGADELVSLLRALTGSRNVIGVDICGGITCSKGANAEILASNAQLRKRLLFEVWGIEEN